MRRTIACVLLSAGLAPMAMAAGIYQKSESDTAVELSNLPADDTYQELIKAPAAAMAPEQAAKTGAPASVPVATSVAAEAARQRALAVRRTVRSADDVDRQAGTDDEPTGATPAALANGRPEGDAPSGAVASSVASSGLAGATSASNQSATGAAPATAVAGATATAGSTGSTAAVTPVAQSTASQVLDSPDLLAARLAQYRSLMVNEAAQAQFLPPNPAVVRRYLMVDRSTYMSQ